jgi:hypothetical protein
MRFPSLPVLSIAPRRHMRRRVVAVALVAATALVAGCGNDPAASTALGTKVDASSPVLVRAMAATEKASTGRVAFSLEASGVARMGTTPVKVEGTGEFDLAKKTSHLTVDPSALLKAATSAAGASGGSSMGADESKLLTSLIGPIELITADKTMYVKSGVLGLLAGSTTPWVSLVLPDAGTAGDATAKSIPAVTPEALLDSLGKVSGNVVTVGHEAVRGTDTTHYRADLSGADLPGMGAAQTTTLPAGAAVLDVFVAADDTVRRIVMTVDLAKASAAASASAGTSVPATTGIITVTGELYDLDSNITVTVPPASQVTNGSALDGLSGLGDLGGLGALFGPR